MCGVRQLIVLGSALVFAALPVTAADSLAAAVRSCAAQADDTARLRCYDHAAAELLHADQMHSRPMLAPADKDPAPAAPVSQQQPVRAPSVEAANDMSAEFGLTHAQAIRKKSNGQLSPDMRRLTGRVARLTRKASGNLVLHLDNDQVWEQTETGPDLHIAAGDEITIDRGLLGAFWLSTHGSRLAIKVQRVQ